MLYTPEKLDQFADWLEENEVNPNIIRMVRFRISKVNFEGLNICNVTDEQMVFEGIKSFRRRFENSIRKQDEEFYEPHSVSSTPPPPTSLMI